jgi:hypothetical protein
MQSVCETICIAVAAEDVRTHGRGIAALRRVASPPATHANGLGMPRSVLVETCA